MEKKEKIKIWHTQKNGCLISKSQFWTYIDQDLSLNQHLCPDFSHD